MPIFSSRPRKSRAATVALFSSTLVTALCASACTAGPLSIANSVVPGALTLVGTCAVSSDNNAPHLNTGIFDVGLSSAYTLYPRFENRAGVTRFVEGLDVELRRGTSDGPLVALPGGVPSQYTLALSATVPLGGDAAPGVTVSNSEVLPASVGLALRTRVCQPQPLVAGCNRAEIVSATEQLVVVARPFGHDAGGGEFQGEYFSFSLTICCGCLVNFPPDADSRDIEGSDCTAGSAPSAGGCAPGQDTLVDCRVCSGVNPLCQPLTCASP